MVFDNELLTELTAQPLLDVATLRSALVFVAGVVLLQATKLLGRWTAALYRWITTERPVPPPQPLSQLAAGLVRELEQPGWASTTEPRAGGAAIARAVSGAWFPSSLYYFYVAERDALAMLSATERARVKAVMEKCWNAVKERETADTQRVMLGKLGLSTSDQPAFTVTTGNVSGGYH